MNGITCMNIYVKFALAFVLSVLLLPSVTFADTYRECLDFNNGLHIGSRDFIKNGEVSRLQDFLISQGFLRSSVTGYYGSQTSQAIKDFQRTNGFSAVGNMGPMTRQKIRKLTCNIVVGNQVTINSMTPSTGPVGTLVTLYGSNFTHENTIQFGSGVIVKVPSTNSQTISFNVPYSLTPACVYANPACMMQMAIFQTPTGTYPVSVTNQNGQVSNAFNFTVTNSQSVVTPVISGVDSPSTLSVNQTGTWSVRASDPEGKGLSYSVLWGDESTIYPVAMTSSQANSFVQTSSFTHSYTNPGVYTVTFTVRGQNGQSAQSSMTVQVSGTTNKPMITSEYPSEIHSFGTTVTIYGTGFTRNTNSINFNGVNNVAVNVPSYDGTSLQFTVPTTPCSQGLMCAQVALGYGSYPITVNNENGTSNGTYIAVTAPNQGGTQVTVTTHVGSVSSINSTADITPLEVIEDSRCPIGVYCIQAGRVVVKTSVRSYDAVQIVNITSGQSVTTVDGYRISITDVQPIKRSGFNINQGDYVITYQVSR